MSLKESYQQRVDKYIKEITALKRKNTGFITGELLSFGAILTFVVCYFAIDDTQLWWYLAALSLVAYFVIRHFDDKNKEQIEHLSALLKVYQNEIKSIDGDFTPFDMGEKYQNPQHPCSFDLDVFGKDSVYNRICRTITTGGADALAKTLTREIPLSREEIASNVALQKELAENDTGWRMELFALGEQNKNQDPSLSSKINSEAVISAIRKVAGMEMPTWFGSSVSLVIGWLLIVGVFVALILSFLDVIPDSISLWWVIEQYLVVFFCCKHTLDNINRLGEKLQHQLVAYSQIIRLVSEREFMSEKGKQMQASLKEALPSFVQLEKILKGYARRGNFLGLFFTDAFLLSDFFLIRSFLKWRRSYMDKMEQWMSTVSEMDAIVSMANYRYNHPEAVDAEIVEGEPIVFEAKNLYHPFLGTKAVKNDFMIDDDNYYIITGANMAGKSTFLRSLGVNYILAMAGMPVFADSLRVSRFQLFSSMRTTDDLTHGISYFNAELLRLEQLMRYCKQGTLRTLIILDEILKGTNSLDKLNGSRLFLEAISKLPVSGVIATHDLELSKMEEAYPDRFHNYCFEIDLGMDVTYTYRIQRGVARNQNATFLLKRVLEHNF